MNIKDAEKILEQVEELQERAAKIATQLIDIEHQVKYHVDADEITVESGKLYARWETYCCGDSDSHEMAIPLEYLFDEEWQRDAEERIQQRRAEEDEARRIRDAKAKLAAVERERKQYLKLKEKFGE